ncbi:hypothetical protein HYU93_01595 [Candidatus Daviesbacteria bacterium]|nr:hypothetical protein [Candidatus Daviesbacteria bacterium]
MDNGQTVQTYTEPFTISESGKTTIQIKSIDKLGNEEIPQTIIIEIAAQATPTPTPATSSASTSGSGSSGSTPGESKPTPEVDYVSVVTGPTQIASLTARNDNGDILGITFEPAQHIADQISISNILTKEKDLEIIKKQVNQTSEILGRLLMVSGGIATLASVGLLATFLKPIPK